MAFRLRIAVATAVAVAGAGGFFVSSLARAQTPLPPTLELDLGGGQSLEVRLVRATVFTQGSPRSESNRSDEEFSRQVTLTSDFYLGTTEVTVGQFGRFAQSASFRTEAEKGESGGFGWDGSQLSQSRSYSWRQPGYPQTDQHPVTLVTHADALAFCAWLQKRTGRSVDLPSEAQWEFAARAGETTAWPGSDDPSLVAWHKGNSSGGAHPVRGLKPNAWGFYDLGGNAAEWCRDWYQAYEPSAQINPVVDVSSGADKPRRVLRGGSWIRDPKHARVAARFRNDPRSRNADNGFRVLVGTTLQRQAANATAPAPVDRGGSVAEARAEPVSIPAPVQRPEFSPAPHSTVSSGSTGFSWTSLLCPLVGLTGFLGALFALIRKFRTRSNPDPNRAPADSYARLQDEATDQWIPARELAPSDVRTEVAPDGFRLFLKSVVAGELVRYSVDLGGRIFTDTIAYHPSDAGHFIYTGVPPGAVTIHGIAAGSEDVLPGQTTLSEHGPGGRTVAGPWSGSGGFGRSHRSETRGESYRNPAAY